MTKPCSDVELAVRDCGGRFVSRHCPDLNCGGSIVAGTDRFGQPVWHCDGLTYDREDGPLRACDVQFEMPAALRAQSQRML